LAVNALAEQKMKEYKFQYTNPVVTNLIFFGCIIFCIFLFFIALKTSWPIFIIVGLNSAATILLFQILKFTSRRNCIVKVDKIFLEFQFKRSTRTIHFSELILYKCYYGRVGPVLYLKTATNRFKLSVNNNFCKTEAFRNSLDAIVIVLDKYIAEHVTILKRGRSFFETRRMLYFLIFAGALYILTVFDATRIWKIIIEIAGGFYLFNMWVAYFINNRKIPK
jgi:hypothetical protein